jgi:hypothetical protein
MTEAAGIPGRPAGDRPTLSSKASVLPLQVLRNRGKSRVGSASLPKLICTLASTEGSGQTMHGKAMVCNAPSQHPENWVAVAFLAGRFEKNDSGPPP